MHRATVLRIHGDSAIGDAIAKGVAMETESELVRDLRTQLDEANKRIRQLEAERGVSAFVDDRDYRKLIADIPKRYPIRKHCAFYNKLLVFVATLWIAHTEGGIV